MRSSVLSSPHPLLSRKSGDLDVTFEQLYEDVVAKMVDAITADGNKHTHLLIIPNLLDAAYDDVYPQAPNPTVEHEVSAGSEVGNICP